MKTFRTEQLRLAGMLLTGNVSEGTLWYNEQKLAIGSTAAEQTTELLPGSGLYGLQDQTPDGTNNPTLIYDSNTDTMTLASDMEVHVSGRSGISVDPDFLWIAEDAIINDQLLNPSLQVIAGSALSTSATNGTIALGGDATLAVKVDNVSIEIDSSVGADHLELKDGVGKVVDGQGVETNTAARAAAGIQELHLQSVDWAKGVAEGGDALAVEHNLSAGDHLEFVAGTDFDGSANRDMTVSDTVVISGAGFEVNGESGPFETQTVGGEKTWEDHATFSRNVVVGGSLTVAGDTIQVDSQHVNIGDNIIVLNADLETNEAPANGGIDVRIGTLEGTSAGLLGGPARIWFNTDSNVRAWQAGNVKDWDTGTEDVTDMWTIHTQKYSRTFSLNLVKDISDVEVNFGSILGGADNSYEFPSIPNIVASISYFGVDGDTDWQAEPESFALLIKDVATTGCMVDLSDGPESALFAIKLHCSTL